MGSCLDLSSMVGVWQLYFCFRASNSRHKLYHCQPESIYSLHMNGILSKLSYSTTWFFAPVRGFISICDVEVVALWVWQLDHHMRQFLSAEVKYEMCWLSSKTGIIWSFLVPAMLILIFNTVTMCRTLKVRYLVFSFGSKLLMRYI